MAEKTEKKEDKRMNLHQKLIEIRKQIPYLQKDAQGFNYKYVKGSVLLGLIRKAMDELGVLLAYDVDELHTENVEKRIFDKKSKQYVNSQAGRTRLKYIFKWIDAESPDEILLITRWFQGIGDDIQDIGSFDTYAIRYFLIGFFNIPCDDDDPDTHEKAITKARPAECLNDEKYAEVDDLIDGHRDIRDRLTMRYTDLKKIPADAFELVVRHIKSEIAKKEGK